MMFEDCFDPGGLVPSPLVRAAWRLWTGFGSYRVVLWGSSVCWFLNALRERNVRNRIGGMSNSGEGGEDPLRYHPIKDHHGCQIWFTQWYGNNVVWFGTILSLNFVSLHVLANFSWVSGSLTKVEPVEETSRPYPGLVLIDLPAPTPRVTGGPHEHRQPTRSGSSANE